MHDEDSTNVQQYKNLQFSLQKNPKRGPSIPLVELTAEGVKKFLESTDLFSMRVKKMQLEFDEKQAFLNIETQLSGNMVDDSEEKPPSEDTLHLILYKLLQKLLLYPASDCLEAEWQRCNEAVNFMVLYCDVLEGGPCRGRLKKTQQPMGSSGPDSDSNSKDVHMIRKQPSTYDDL
ncbi:hypothetical protein CISG_09227 [Coccidioides immitis RMSCC 3703]|uniref:Uncharacterized protein n=1 Tax=Coccidioides immitis RMSCC 3703 TaxID=454286 RepID=A0A0J8R9A6_COCIT|nr:hypothetical protein CISG_09227 [Coccidioides immitis RMSCC 3703]